MKTILYLFLLTCLSLPMALAAPIQETPFANWTASELMLNNGVVQLTIQLPASAGNFLTRLYKPVAGDFQCFAKTSPDFKFSVNGVTYAGSDAWKQVGIQKIKDDKQGDGAAVTLQSQDGKVELTVRFLLYPDMPVIRKNLIVKNLTNEVARLESVDVGTFTVPPYYAPTFSWIFGDYGRRRTVGPYKGTMQDALVIVYNPDWKHGIVIGNEASGVMKRTAAFWEGPELCAGLTHSTDRFPFRKWLAPGESFETPAVFTMVYTNHKNPDEILNMAVPAFARKHLGIRLSVLAEKLIKELAGALPIMLGDPRKLSESDLKKYRRYADWLQATQTRYDFMSYRQDLAGFGEPMDGMWDGFQRINTDSKRGGIVGVFRHGSPETKRMVTVSQLEPALTYRVKTMDGKRITSLTGQALQTTGFAVNLTQLYDGELFELSTN